MWIYFYGFFFFKQKTAYEMRISDWSSDVCSSDLADFGSQGGQCPRRRRPARRADREGPQGPGLRARPACRLDRAVLRPAARGRRRGAAADRRQGGAARQVRERSEERRVGKECVSTC